MATTPVELSGSVPLNDARPWSTAARWVGWLLRPLASLKLTVVLFALAIIVILVGTLAQVEKDIWRVLEDYFKPWILRVDVPILFPRSWFPQRDPELVLRVFAGASLLVGLLCGTMIIANAVVGAPTARDRRSSAIWRAGAAVVIAGLLSISTLWTGGFWMPGGALIGALMCLNLLSAHLLRFRMCARGRKRAIGLAIAAVGVFLTCLVVLSGHNADGFQGQPPFRWETLWVGVKIGLSVIGVGLVGFALATPARSDSQRHVRWFCGGMGVGLVLLTGWLWATGDRTYLGDSGMRVLWQLILGLGASLVLLLGAIPLFGRRAGIVVLHAGVGLLMFGQWFVSNYDVEEQITMAEGATVNYAQDIRNLELAVIDRGDSAAGGQDDVVVIPLTRNGKSTKLLDSERIADEQLPFHVEVVQFLGNALVEQLPAGQSTPATLGNGLRFSAVQQRGAAGVSSNRVDLAAGYFRFVDKNSGAILGTVLLAQDQLMMRGGQTVRFDTERIRVGDQSRDVQLRFARSYKDYSLRLIDVTKDDYLGTSIPRNYSSQVELIDPKRGIQQELKIWMNNPRRYAGETFYQSGWRMDPLTKREYSTLQVVRNQGWMIPYVACMVCMVGMLAHFSLMLLRFLNRQTAGPAGDGGTMVSAKSRTRSRRDSRSPRRWAQWLVPAGVLAAAGLLLVRVATPPKTADDELQVEQFGELPLVYQGRVKPFDTLARNSLRVISDAETFRGVLPAEEWSASGRRSKRS